MRIIEGLVRAAYRRARPASEAREGEQQADTRQLVNYAISKGAVPIIRGLVLRPRLGSSTGALFLGKGTTIRYPRLLHLGSGCSIGNYCQIDCLSTKGVWLGDGVTLREFGWIQLSSSPNDLGTELVVEANTYIGPGAVLGAGAPVRIGSECQIGASFMLSAEEHLIDTGEALIRSGVKKQGIQLGNGCWIGNRVTVLDGVEIGSGAVIGAGAVVVDDVPPLAVAVGIPARVIRFRSKIDD